jgi:hypothetical protein
MRSLSIENIVRAEEAIEAAFRVDETADGAPLLEHWWLKFWRSVRAPKSS